MGKKLSQSKSATESCYGQSAWPKHAKKYLRAYRFKSHSLLNFLKRTLGRIEPAHPMHTRAGGS
jgi:hypothetical protein